MRCFGSTAYAELALSFSFVCGSASHRWCCYLCVNVKYVVCSCKMCRMLTYVYRRPAAPTVFVRMEVSKIVNPTIFIYIWSSVFCPEFIRGHFVVGRLHLQPPVFVLDLSWLNYSAVVKAPLATTVRLCLSAALSAARIRRGARFALSALRPSVDIHFLFVADHLRSSLHVFSL